MVQKVSQGNESISSPENAQDTAAAIFQQMEILRREILLLNRRAQKEVEETLRLHSEPLYRIIAQLASNFSATEVSVSLQTQPNEGSFVSISGFEMPKITETDLLQCRLALSGREMHIDFVRMNIYLPVVVFENPLAVVILKVPNLKVHSYEKICALACKGIAQLREELKIQRHSHVISHEAS